MKRRVNGAGLLNRVIDKLPFESHLVGYRYCGPGTRLEERLARGDKPINPLDEACQEHDIAYQRHKEDVERAKADRVLANKAWKRYKSRDVPWGEKIASWLVTTGMNAKTKMGGNVSKRRKGSKGKKQKKGGGLKKRQQRKRSIPFGSIVRHGRMAIRGAGIRSTVHAQQVKKAAQHALKAIKQLMKNRSMKRWSSKGKKERVLALPKTGGVLPLLPIFAGLSAIGSLAGGAAGIAKTIAEVKDAKRQLAELSRHNKTMEAIALRKGKGLYLKPHKKGLGLYMTPFVKQSKNL